MQVLLMSILVSLQTHFYVCVLCSSIQPCVTDYLQDGRVEKEFYKRIYKVEKSCCALEV